jgi:hypothetical protein
MQLTSGCLVCFGSIEPVTDSSRFTLQLSEVGNSSISNIRVISKHHRQVIDVTIQMQIRETMAVTSKADKASLKQYPLRYTPHPIELTRFAKRSASS